MNCADTTKGNLLKHSLGIVAMPFRTAYLAACLTLPSDAAPGLEPPPDAGYVRTPTRWMWDPTRPAEARLAVSVQFAPAKADWGDIGFLQLWDAIEGGNPMYWMPILDPEDRLTPKPITVANGEIMRFAAGNLVVVIPT